jgi:G:T/U-mismatch repair DNA glycosylase
MPDPALEPQVTSMRTVLQSIEAQLARGRFSLDGLTELKRTIDDMRTQVWALMATAGDDSPAAIERLKVRRTAELCRAVTQGLAAGGLQANHRELEELRVAAAELAVAIERAGRV